MSEYVRYCRIGFLVYEYTLSVHSIKAGAQVVINKNIYVSFKSFVQNNII